MVQLFLEIAILAPKIAVLENTAYALCNLQFFQIILKPVVNVTLYRPMGDRIAGETDTSIFPIFQFGETERLAF